MAAKTTQSFAFDPKQIEVRVQNGVLILKHENGRTELAPPKRALPLSSPEEFIVLSSVEGAEIGMVRHVSQLDPLSREALRTALEEAYQITAILRVLEVEREPLGGQITWRVIVEEKEADDSQSGREATFRLAGAEDVQTARYPHIYFSDVDGNRWEIPDCEAMDLPSRRASERYF